MQKFTDTIKSEGDSSTIFRKSPDEDFNVRSHGDNPIVWKHPCEDFNTGAQLIVHESQEAVFMMNGQVLDLLTAGRHTLSTENLPFIGRFFNEPTDGKTPFHCEVYFVNKAEQLAVKWGTDSKLEYIEPIYGFPLQVGASGEMSLRVKDSRRLLVKIVGTEDLLTQSGLIRLFRMFVVPRVKAYLATVLKKDKISIFEIDEQLIRLSDELKVKLSDEFADYGVSLERFFVTNIVKPEEDIQYRRFKDLHYRQFMDVKEAELRQQIGVIEQQTKARQTLIEAQAKAEKRSLEGYTYRDERGFDVAERMAANDAIGQMTNLGIGVGMINGVGATIGQTVGGIMRNTFTGTLEESAPETAGKEIAPNASSNELTQTAKSHINAMTNGVDISDFELRIKKLEILKEKITEERYQEKLEEIMSMI